MRVAVLLTNLIQHEIPFLQSISKTDLDIEVIYFSDEGLGNFNAFGLKNISYEMPMLDGYKSIILKNKSPFKNHRLRYIAPSIGKVLKNGNYDRVLLYGYNSPTAWMAIYSCKKFNIPIYLRAEGESVQQISKLKQKIRGILLPKIFSCFDGFTAICSANKEHYLKYNVSAKKIGFVSQTVNDSFFASSNKDAEESLRSKYNIDENTVIFIYGSKLRKEKEPLDAVRAFCNSNRNTKTKLIMLSDGSERENCEAHVKTTKNEDRVIFTGYIPFEEMRDLFNLADVLLITSSETIGATLYQALFSGLAIISSDMVPGWLDTVKPGYNGIVYRKGNIGFLQRSIESLVEQPELIAKMKQNSKSLSSYHTSELAAIQFENFINRLG